MDAIERVAQIIGRDYGPYENKDGVDASVIAAQRLADAGLLFDAGLLEEEMAFLRGAAAGMSAENDALKAEIEARSNETAAQARAFDRLRAAIDRTSIALTAERALTDDLAARLAIYAEEFGMHEDTEVLARWRKARGL